MWKSIWEVLKTLLTYEERLARLEKRSEKQEQRQSELTTELTAVFIELGRMAEREKWREEKYQQVVELERSKLEIERLHLELERERQRRQLPPADKENGQT